MVPQHYALEHSFLGMWFLTSAQQLILLILPTKS
jgi:hypothetical protein